MSELLPPVVGRLLGDTRDFSDKMRAARMQAGEDTEGMGSSAERMRGRVGGAFTAVGGLATGAGVMLEHMGHQGEVAEAQLKTAIDNTGKSFPDYEDRIGKATDKMMGFGFSHSATEKALAQLTTSTQDPAKGLDLIGGAADIARAKGMSLEAAAGKLSLAMAGNTRIFKQFGVTLPPGATAMEKQAALAEVLRRVHGQAAEQADNFGGKVNSLKQHFEAMGESVGKRVGPALTMAGPLMMGVGQIISTNVIPAMISGIGAAIGWAGSMIGAGISAAAAAIPVIIAWAPIFLTIAALVAAGYFIYTNWDTIWAGIKDLVGAAVGFIKGHIDEFIGILFPPIGVFFLIRDHWRDVWNTMKDLVGSVIGGISSVVKGGINDVLGVINKFIEGVNSLEIHIPSVGIGPLKTPGFDWNGLGIPQIPYLAAGGVAFKAGWAVVGDEGPELMHMPAGASVSPLPAGGGAGGGVVIHLHVTGNTILGGDVRKLAQDLVEPIRTELIRVGGRQALGLPA